MDSLSWLTVPDVILPVIRQTIGICWAIVGTEAISSQYKALHPDTEHLRLSLEEAVDGCRSWYYKLYPDRLPNHVGLHYEKLFMYVMQKGLSLEADYEINPEGRRCFIQNYVSLREEEEVIEALKKFPVAGGVTVYISLKNYKGEGYYNGPTEEELSDESKYREGLHAILLTGFKVMEGVGVYEFKNSWGLEWGRRGTGYIRRDLVFDIAHPIMVFWKDKSMKSSNAGTSKGKKNYDGDDFDRRKGGGGAPDSKFKRDGGDDRKGKKKMSESTRSGGKNWRPGGIRSHTGAISVVDMAMKEQTEISKTCFDDTLTASLGLAFLEEVQLASLVPDNATPPTNKPFEVVSQIFEDEGSLASHQFLPELNEGHHKGISESSTPAKVLCELVVIEEDWSPFCCSKMDKATSTLDGPINSSVLSLIEDTAKRASKGRPKTIETKLLRNMLPFQYLIDVLERDLVPRVHAFEQSLNWILLRKCIVNKVLGSRRVSYKNFVEDYLSLMGDLHLYDNEMTHYQIKNETFLVELQDCHTALKLAFPEVEKSTCIALKKLLQMVMELDSSRNIADIRGLVTKVDGAQIPAAEIILNELAYDNDLLFSFFLDWSPFGCSKIDKVTTSGGSINCSGFLSLIGDTAIRARKERPKTKETELLRNMLPMQYLIDVLERDLAPHVQAFEQSLNRILSRKCTVNKTLVFDEPECKLKIFVQYFQKYIPKLKMLLIATKMSKAAQ